MNLITLFLSLLINFMSPSLTNTGANNEGSGNYPTKDNGKQNKMGEGDYIIQADGNP